MAPDLTTARLVARRGVVAGARRTVVGTALATEGAGVEVLGGRAVVEAVAGAWALAVVGALTAVGRVVAGEGGAAAGEVEEMCRPGTVLAAARAKTPAPATAAAVTVLVVLRRRRSARSRLAARRYIRRPDGGAAAPGPTGR